MDPNNANGRPQTTTCWRPPHPPYSPDIALRDYYHSPEIKKHLGGTYCATEEKLLEEIDKVQDEYQNTFLELKTDLSGKIFS